MSTFSEAVEAMLDEEKGVLTEQGPIELASQVSTLASKVAAIANRLPDELMVYHQRRLSQLLEHIRQLLVRAVEVLDRLSNPDSK